MRSRRVDGPDEDLLEILEVAKYLRVSKRTLERLIAEGEFPQAIDISDGVQVWPWTDVLYYRLRRELKPRLTTPESPPSDATERHAPPTGKRDKPAS